MAFINVTAIGPKCSASRFQHCICKFHIWAHYSTGHCEESDDELMLSTSTRLGVVQRSKTLPVLLQEGVVWRGLCGASVTGGGAQWVISEERVGPHWLHTCYTCYTCGVVYFLAGNIYEP